MRTLILTNTYKPHAIWDWKESICSLVTKKIYVLENYEATVSSPSITLQIPAVAVLKRHVDMYKTGVKFSRGNVFSRDSLTCQYCQKKLPSKQLNYDHVLPFSRGGRTNFANIATSCYPCNNKKGNRTPEEAGMPLARKPFVPKVLPLDPFVLDIYNIPEQWKPYLPVSLFTEVA